MAITYVASGTPQFNASAALTVPWPTHQVGDLALLVVTMNVSGGFADPTNLTTPNGFKPLTQFFYNQTNGNSTRIWWCLATSTSMASPITNINADALGTRAIIHTFRGVDQVVPCIAGVYGPNITAAASTNLSTNQTVRYRSGCKWAYILTSATNSTITTTNTNATYFSNGAINYNTPNNSQTTSLYTTDPIFGDENFYALSFTLSASSAASYAVVQLLPPFTPVASYSRSRVVNN